MEDIKSKFTSDGSLKVKNENWWTPRGHASRPGELAPSLWGSVDPKKRVKAAVEVAARYDILLNKKVDEWGATQPATAAAAAEEEEEEPPPLAAAEDEEEEEETRRDDEEDPHHPLIHPHHHPHHINHQVRRRRRRRRRPLSVVPVKLGSRRRRRRRRPQLYEKSVNTNCYPSRSDFDDGTID